MRSFTAYLLAPILILILVRYVKHLLSYSSGSFFIFYFLFKLSEPPKGESNYEEAVEFDPIAHHSQFCPWVNGNVAAAGSNSRGSATKIDAIALCGWQLTIDALDALRSLGNVAIQTVQSESAASLYKVLPVGLFSTYVQVMDI